MIIPSKDANDISPTILFIARVGASILRREGCKAHAEHVPIVQLMQATHRITLSASESEEILGISGHRLKRHGAHTARPWDYAQLLVCTAKPTPFTALQTFRWLHSPRCCPAATWRIPDVTSSM